MRKTNKKALYENIMKNVSKQVKKTLNEDFNSEEYLTIEPGDQVYLDLTLSKDDNNDFCVFIQDHIGGSELEAFGSTPEEAANEAAKYIADYFYVNEDDNYVNEDDDEEY